MRRFQQLSLAVLGGLLLVGAAFQKDKDLPRNHPSLDPYTGGDPELMAAAGIVSLGGFEFGKTDTGEVDAYLATNDIKWIETEHFEIGFALGYYKVKQKEKKRLFEELTRMQEKLPEVNPKAKSLDPWLRAHLTAQRVEDLYQEFLGIVRASEDEFPDGSRGWDMTGDYMGEGPYLGQKGKYEILILPNESSSVAYLKWQFGLSIPRTQRWNVVDRDSLVVVTHTEQGRLREDRAMHGHLAFNLAHNMLDGYRHYSYDTPLWLHEGLAHYMERKVDPKNNSFDGSEGAVPEMTRKWKWKPEVKKLVNSGDAPRMAELIHMKSYGDMELPEHFCTWSMVDFLITTRPEEFAGLIDSVKGLMDAEGIANGSDIPDKHREAFKELFGWTYPQFDKAWGEWVLETY